jgi:hypothetical protein
MPDAARIDLLALTGLVADAVAKSVTRIGQAYPRERVTGYALATDDDLGTLFHVACTAESESESPLLAGFGDWTREAPSDPFGAVNKVLRRWAHESGDDESEAHEPVVYRGIFEALVAGLLQARHDGLFADDVFLVVGSTDPGPAIERLEHEAVERLNPPPMVRKWREVRLTAAREELAELRSRPRDRWSYADIDDEERLKREIDALEAALG